MFVDTWPTRLIFTIKWPQTSWFNQPVWVAHWSGWIKKYNEFIKLRKQNCCPFCRGSLSNSHSIYPPVIKRGWKKNPNIYIYLNIYIWFCYMFSYFRIKTFMYGGFPSHDETRPFQFSAGTPRSFNFVATSFVSKAPWNLWAAGIDRLCRVGCWMDTWDMVEVAAGKIMSVDGKFKWQKRGSFDELMVRNDFSEVGGQSALKINTRWWA